MIEINQDDAYKFVDKFIEFPSSTKEKIESIELDGIEILLHSGDLVLSDKNYRNQEVVKTIDIKLIENSSGLRGNTMWQISTFYTKDEFYICKVTKNKWKGSWTKSRQESVFYKCTLNGLLELVGDSQDWF